MDTTQSLPDFIKLWNFADPAQTEQKFRELLPIAESSNDASYLAQLWTQIARTFSLRDKFDEAHSILDTVHEMLTPDLKLAKVRYLLERGRTFNSSNRQSEAVPLFVEAYELAESIGQKNLAIDAVHMVAIAEANPTEQVVWNLKGISMAEEDQSTRGWLWALYNNIGESYLLLKQYENARTSFQKLVDFQKEKGREPDIFTMKDLAKATRLYGNPKEAYALIEPVFRKLQNDMQDNGIIAEELAEDLYAMGNEEEAKRYFAKAYELLADDEWYQKNGNPERLKKLGS